MGNDVLEEMKQQMAVLNDMLDKEEIISKDMIRVSMRKDYSWVINYLTNKGLGVGFVTLYFGVSGILGDLKWWLCVLVIAICIFEYIRDIKYLKIREEEFLTLPILDIQQRMSKNPHRISVIIFDVISISIIFLWFFQIYQQEEIGKLLALIIGGLIGEAIGIYHNHKIKKTRNKILSDIEKWDSSDN